jgi:CubicO group peptidase (beta-lactamase class C family)
MIPMHSKHLLLVILLINLAFGCSPETKELKNYISGWERSSPDTQGIDKLVIDSIHQEIQNGDYGLIDHFLLMRNGKIVADYHYDQDYETISKNYDTTRHQYNYDHPDWHPYYNNTSLHSLQSVSKSVTSLLLGIAMDEGLVMDLDSAIAPLFDDYSFDADDRKKSITLKNLLTMQSGILWDESSSYADNQENNCTVMELTDDWIQYVLDRPMDTIPGTKFVYNSGITVLLGKIVRIATGKRIDKWAEEKLFGPLGITEYYWKETPKGEIDTEGGLYLSAYDLAKIGYLMMNKGAWDNKQIVSEKWVEESIRPSVQFNEQRGYGYQWWVPEYENEQTKIFAGNGYGGQFIMMAEEYDMLVVFNGWNIHGRADKSTWRALQDRILPKTTLRNN